MRHRFALPALGIVVAAGLSVAAPIEKGQLTRSDTCEECHRDIFRMWRVSAHAHSMEDPLFLDAYRMTKSGEGTAVSRICLGCHAPAVDWTHDAELEQKVSWEGVGCDICHSIASVSEMGAGARFTLDVGRVKRGPIQNAASTAHEVAYSELHTKALVCAPCHEFANAEGTPLMTTYSEWKGSGAARAGKSCQSCHMGTTRARVVDPRVKRVPDAEVNLHEVPGSHSLDQLNKALEVGLDPRRDGGQLLLDVRLKNRGAGHGVPTGMPGRRVTLTVKVRTSQGASFEQQRVYTRSFASAAGSPVTQDSGYFARGARQVADTRIRPDEERLESFRFPLPPEATAYVTAKLHYEHSPTGRDENRTWLTFYSEERTLLPASPPGR